MIFFSIIMDAEYSFYVKSIAMYQCLPKSWHNNSFLGSVISQLYKFTIILITWNDFGYQT